MFDWLVTTPFKELWFYIVFGVPLVGLIIYFLTEFVAFDWSGSSESSYSPNGFADLHNHVHSGRPSSTTPPLVFTRETMPKVHVCENPVFDLAEFQPPPIVQQPVFQEVHISYPDSPTSNDLDDIPFNTNPNNGRSR